MMNALENRLRNAQRKVAPLAPWIRFTNHKDARLMFEQLANFIGTQIPHFGDFRNGIMPLDVHRGLDLGWYGHCVAATPPGFAKINEYFVD
jgi:hypothetical protein